ncbi:MAG: hypothetical protein IJA60_03115 [Clostridia bacterium]|nr:hypothetical protein [Clostridia bacterium]
MKFTEKVEINNYDVDMHGIMRPTQLIAKLEEIGSHQMAQYPPSNDDLRKEGKGFILSRVVMSIHMDIHEGDDAVGETWATDSRGLSFARCYCLNIGGEIAAKVYTVWALLDINEKKLIRVEEYPRQLGGAADPCFDMSLSIRVRMPKADEFEEIAKRKVYYSDTDLNRHMNNTKYLNMFCDFVPDIENKSLKGINISYISEAPLGEELTVMHKELDGVHYFKTIRTDGKTNCEAVLYF